MIALDRTNDSTGTAWLETLTVAHAILFVILLAGATLRLSDLGGVPLSPVEAQQALQVWRLWEPVDQSLNQTFSPAYLHLTALVAPLLGFGDVTMRLVPALLGTAMVALPWLLRRQLGDVGALLASLLLALSPTAVALARTAGGDALALFAVTLLLVALIQLATPASSQHWIYVASAALALGVASSPLFYNALLAFAVAYALQRMARFGRINGSHHLDRVVLQRAALVAAAVYFAVGLLFLWNPLGLGATTMLFIDWLDSFGLPGLPVLLAMLRYEAPMLLLAVVAAVWLLRYHLLARFLLVALFIVLSLSIVQPDEMPNLTLVVVIAATLIAPWADTMLRAPFSRFTWVAVGLLLVAGLVIIFQLARYSRLAGLQGSFFYLLIPALAAAIAILGVQVVYNLNRRAVAPGLLVGFLPLLIIINWGTAWWLGHAGIHDTREIWVQSASDDELPLLVESVREVGGQVKNFPEALRIISIVDNPALEWYFRDYPHFETVGTVPPGATDEVILTPSTTTPALGADYYSAAFGLQRTGIQEGAPATLPGRFHWLLTHQSPLSMTEERVILWVRADLDDE